MNRRTFLRGFAGLAAVAACPSSLAALPQTDRERLIAQMRDGGLIENQTFVIRDGRSVVLDNIRNLTIRDCRFIWTKPVDGSALVVGRNCENLTLIGCHIGANIRSSPVGSALQVEAPNFVITSKTPHGIYWRHA